MRKKKINYHEGSVFLVPLRDIGFARGVVCRMDGEGRVFGHFFPPRLASKDAAESRNMADLHPKTSLLCGRFGDLGLIEYKWPVVGEIEEFDRKIWTLPAFARKVAGDVYISIYNENTLNVISDYRLDVDKSFPADVCEDGLMGYGYVEIKLTRLMETFDKR